MKNIGIIGGGTAGLTAAIIAAKKGAKVTIIEHRDRVGKKLSLTGSGKCNISNLDMSANHFHSSHEDKITQDYINNLFDICPPSEVYNFIKDLGIYLKDRNGYLYPYSESANAVVDSLRFAIKDLDINVLLDTEIKKIITENNSNIKVITNHETLFFNKIIICCGSNAYAKTGSDGSGYSLARSLKAKVIKPLPALTYLSCIEDFYPSIAGIRIKANITLLSTKDKTILGNEIGELQINKNGISGIPVFNLSHLASKAIDKGINLMAQIDFIPDISNVELIELINQKIKNYPKRSLEELFIGILPKNLGILIIKRCGLNLKNTCSKLDNANILQIVDMIKCFDTCISATGPFDNSQVACGGVDILDLDYDMQSKHNKGIYYAGEIIDINGDCGGYNLHFAFTTAIIAGRNVCF